MAAAVVSPMLVLALAASYGCGGSGGPIGAGLPAAYLAADGIRGGKAYDKFWDASTGFNQADPNIATFNAKSDFFRCKQCHGWDLLGRAGAYINRAPNTNRPNVSSVNLIAFATSHTPQEIYDALKKSAGRRAVNADLSTYDPATNPTVGDQMPDIGSFLPDSMLWDLVKYLKTQALDVTLLYDFTLTGTYPTGSIAFSNIGKDGNAAAGDTVFASKCSGCHGANGAAFLVDGGTVTVGKFMRTKPHEGWHKIKFGQLGSSMGSQVTDTAEMKNLLKALTNAAKYVD
jgi:thiosulfate dehydrogenase